MRGEAAGSLLPLFLFLVVAPRLPSNGQAAPADTSDGYNCSADRSIYPCQAYAFYRAGADSGLLDLASIGDLFGASRLVVARASNLSANATLRPGQPLLVPLTCACGASTNRSYSAVSYQIVAGDTFYGVSTFKFSNLTSYPAVEAVNPSLVPTDLDIGVIAAFPVFCQCPVGRNSTAGLPGLAPGLVTYVFQPSDSYASIASRFGTDVPSLVALNGREGAIRDFSTILIPVSRIPPPFLLTRTSPSAPDSPPPSPPDKQEHGGVVVGLAISVGLLGLLAALLLLTLAGFWRRNRGRRMKGEEDWEKGRGRDKRFGGSGGDEKLMADISELMDKYSVHQIEDLRKATSDFDFSHLIQGSVYKGVLGGQVCAIKRMKWNACDELKILQKVNHTNLVKLEGFCIEPDDGTCYLVYEYVENGSLHSWLHDPDVPRRLDWRTRLRVALDLANGLQYIHEHTWPRVVHKDIKSSNVLLDARMHAKIANFGLARSGCNAVTTHIVGTQGYIAPEYLADGLVTTKMDVFAYGVVLLELVSGREAVGESGEALWAEAEEEGVFGRREGRLASWMDPALSEQTCPMESVVSVMSIARACLQRDPSKRPSMVDVAYTLSKADDLFSDFSEDGLPVGSGDVVAR